MLGTCRSREIAQHVELWVRSMIQQYRPFLLVRDGFYPEPERVRRIAQSMNFSRREGITGYMSTDAYLPSRLRSYIQGALPMKITRWKDDGTNGIFYCAFAGGGQRETPGVHYDTPLDDITIVVYLTPRLPVDCGTSLWMHKATRLIAPPSRSDSRRLGIPIQTIRDRLESASTRRNSWIEVDRAGYRFNRMVAYPSGLLHSATRHYGSGLADGRIYQTFRIGVDWSTA